MSTCRAFLACCVLLGASCATHPVSSVDVPPATEPWRSAPATRPRAEIRGPEAPAAEGPAVDGTSDAATDRWLSEQIGTRIEEERQEQQARTNAEAYRRAERQSRQRERVIERRTVYESPYYERPYYDDGDVYRRHSYGFFPWNTLFFGGLGAVIGHQSGHRDRGLAIGAGVGLLLDTARASRW